MVFGELADGQAVPAPLCVTSEHSQCSQLLSLCSEQSRLSKGWQIPQFVCCSLAWHDCSKGERCDNGHECDNVTCTAAGSVCSCQGLGTALLSLRAPVRLPELCCDGRNPLCWEPWPGIQQLLMRNTFSGVPEIIPEGSCLPQKLGMVQADCASPDVG